MSTQSLQLLPLGYPEANDLHLFRSKEGIVCQTEEKRKFRGLLNYPTTVQFSRRAIRKLDDESRNKRSTIEIYANLKSGKKIPLFGINGNFFRRVQRDRNTDKASIDYDVSPFKYDLREKSFKTVLDKKYKAISVSERSFSSYDSKAWETGNSDIVTSLGAKYSHAAVICHNPHKFTPKFFKVDEFSEKIVLQIGVKKNNDWDLTICQRQGLS